MGRFRKSILMLGLSLVAACEVAPTTSPPPAPKPAPQVQSDASRDLQIYFGRVQADLLARGLLRTDGGGPDTPYTPDMMARNFEQIAFYDEYASGGGLKPANGTAGKLRRWSGPVRVSVEYGASVSSDMRAQDTALVQGYVGRLASVTNHAISYNSGRPNFHVLVMGEDDKDQLARRLRQIIPGASTATMSLFLNVQRSIDCLVVAFSSEGNDHDYKKAVALVRSEHPDLMRKSCYHEEIAQGLGLANDSPTARPSIFNDDDEFALLTTHDESLLAILYDPRLQLGMSLEQARPVVHILAREQAGRIY
ncbi:DUF2927 domain-containing protein [Shimia thalassica]|nr:DUF2927 domain-containing protein [Shimia thalassica]MDP2492458.1 DUF2927 domain-containing protein [Shimia thalassica]